MYKKILNFNVLVSLFCVFSLCGCAVALVGIGAAGAGATAYFNGKLTKMYESEYHETVQACSATLDNLKIPVTETIKDELKAEIKARRPDGTPVAIEIVRIEQDLTQVSVRTGSLGIWNKRVSEQIHGYINQNLDRKPIAGQKSSANSSPDDFRSKIGQEDQPQIIEEDLADISIQETVQTDSSADSGRQAQTEAPSKFTQMAADSVFIIFFNQNSNALSQKAVTKLDQIYEILIMNSNAEITLHGYSDSIGSASYNKMISEIRANAVKSYLIGKGIAPRRVTAVGHGSQKFIASNQSAAGRRLNRRVEIELINP